MRFVATALAALAFGSASAQILERPTLYRLEPDSTFQRGCFPPCMCPIMEAVPLRGTFVLQLVNSGDVYDFYDVRGVRLRARRTNTPEDDLLIRGAGTYKVSALADLQQMTLDLRVGSEATTTYSSDEVAGGESFPRIHVAISIHGGYCVDTVLDLVASPARRFQVWRDGLDWDPAVESQHAFDVVRGDLDLLRQSQGDFEAATSACVADGAGGNWIPFTDNPPAGRGFWFLDREEGGRYDDEDDAQVGSADAEIALAPMHCP